MSLLVIAIPYYSSFRADVLFKSILYKRSIQGRTIIMDDFQYTPSCWPSYSHILWWFLLKYLFTLVSSVCHYSYCQSCDCCRKQMFCLLIFLIKHKCINTVEESHKGFAMISKQFTLQCFGEWRNCSASPPLVHIQLEWFTSPDFSLSVI